jgi:hypothetical protein
VPDLLKAEGVETVLAEGRQVGCGDTMLARSRGWGGGEIERLTIKFDYSGWSRVRYKWFIVCCSLRIHS